MSARAHLETYRISHQAAHCKIHCLEGIADLIHCSSLTCLDLQQNNMRGEPEDMIHLFTSVPSLACLYLQGNPIVGSLQNYRKRMISEISTLTYLDDRPVFSLERVCAEAFANGGIKAERQARIDYKMLEDAKLSMNHSTLLNMRENAAVKRRIVSKQGKKAFQNAGFDIRNLNQAYEIDLETTTFDFGPIEFSAMPCYLRDLGS